jgi:hypothetical protein
MRLKPLIGAMLVIAGVAWSLAAAAQTSPIGR